MVDEETAADPRSGMNFDAGEKARNLRNEAGQNRYIGFVQTVREAMKQDRVKSRITENDLESTLRGGIFAEYGFELFPDNGKHRRPAGLRPTRIDVNCLLPDAG
jgi:hypothetical protein